MEPRAAGRVLVGDVGVGDQDGMRLVVDAGYYVSVGLEGEDQRRVVLAEKADPGVAAVGRGGVEPERVVDVLAGACGFGAGIGDGIGYGEEELDGEEEEQEQGSHRAREWGSRGRDPEGCSGLFGEVVRESQVTEVRVTTTCSSTWMWKTTLEYWTASDNRYLIAPWHGLSSLHLQLFMSDGYPASASGLPVMNNHWTGFVFLITTTCFSVFDGSESSGGPSSKMVVGRA